ncbi:WD40-repeat-containing domain protein [Naematelia encephala]|uniref:WD40-repeat-containing domain protein n=1 Tax=Naematelia encephala TaxID=71784 RepID=A0A1Y2BEZ7_9TREE|nr:WD40-repeat-containing domain protein [Naematelia encephala]
MTLPPLLQYESQFPLYGVAFSHSIQHPHRTALASQITGSSNRLSIVDLADSFTPYPSGTDFLQLATAGLPFPATKIGWEPAQSLQAGVGEDQGGRGELLATTGDVLRIWEMQRDWQGEQRGRGYIGENGRSLGGGGAYSLTPRSVLTNSKSPQLSLPPITSFGWSPISPKNIVTCSIDTTATLWDINTSQALTQLIAHDRAVFDLSWLPDSSDIFVSVGADGSLRAFDLRTLEHSTILYESSEETPLARISFSNREQHMLACFGLEENKVLILDMRSPGQPVAELLGHQAPVNAIGWGSGGNGIGTTGGGWIASCGDDSQLLLYDLTEPLPSESEIPSRSSSRPTPSAPSNKISNGLSPNNPYTLSPPPTPSQSRGTPSPAQAVEMFPSRAWSADSELNNLTFSDDGQWIGCVSGSKLSVLHV